MAVSVSVRGCDERGLCHRHSKRNSEDIQVGKLARMDDGPVRVVGTVVWYQAPGEME